ncbi:MAG: hexosaminidase [Flavobacteriales bacterium]|jgi:hexosaminidase
MIKSARQLTFLGVLLCICILVSCEEAPPLLDVSMDERVLIPLPRKLTPNEETFVIYEKTKLYVTEDADAYNTAEYLQSYLKKGMSFFLPIEPQSHNRNNSGIYILLDKEYDGVANEEGYTLVINQQQLTLTAKSGAGLERGVQTILQLLPDSLFDEKTTPMTIIGVPGCIVEDYPEFAYRGAMLDVARHFFEVDDVKRYIDLIAGYKMNTLHLHLADDQGWRIEIKSWPKLTTIGGSTAVGGGKGGFYTQDDYEDLVAFAAERHITIIPEIDMPGHTNAALASYPELNCDGQAPDLYTGMRVGFSSLCVDKELTYVFLDDVIGELAAMTPGKYIHIGGDESHATPKEDYISFLNKAQAIVRKHGKVVMGWEDISAATLKKGSIVQHWTSAKVAIKGIEQGAKVVLSPAPKTYLDMKYDSASRIGLTWAGHTSVDSAYVWQPLEVIKGVSKKDILGIESPLWSETAVTMDDIEYLAFPRIIGHAELGWSDPNVLTWVSYRKRMRSHRTRLDLLKVNYYAAAELFK